MLAYERKQQIIELMRKNNRVVTVDYLCKTLFASGATIRRDLKDLEGSRLIHRTHGGAVLIEGGSTEDPLIFRENQNSIKKQVIADIALKYIQDGMIIFLDSSTTVFMLAKKLARFNNLKVITNGIKTAMLLSDYKNIQLMCTGGILSDNSKSLVGLSAKDFISHYNADIAFMSCRGFSVDNGASEASETEYYVKTQFIANSKKSILMCDTSKMGLDFLCRLAPLSAFNDVITEKKDVNDLCSQYTQQHKSRV
ncbi:MAG TPA: DeoR/GlpR transcriptional regulator [Ruminococcaceae bacterium]|nr:DeoR/GlpR transcriptional regulator [Oscillospiraceae bacterium]